MLNERCSGKACRASNVLPTVFTIFAFVVICAGAPCADAQTPETQTLAEAPAQLALPPKPAEQTGPPVTITLADALQRAQRNDAQFLSALSDQRSALEDRLQARNARLPQFSARSEYLGTQGTESLPTDDLLPKTACMSTGSGPCCIRSISANTLMGIDYKRSAAAEAIATAKAEIARRGLTVTVTKTFYALVVAQRKYATAQQALDQTRRFFQLTQDTEGAGQAAHSDVIKARFNTGSRRLPLRKPLWQWRLRDSISPFSFSRHWMKTFTAVDDLNAPRPLPTFGEAQQLAGQMNPDIGVAMRNTSTGKPGRHRREERFFAGDIVRSCLGS